MEGGGRKIPAPISTFENFLDIYAIPSKCALFYLNLLDNKILEKGCVKGNTWQPVFDAIFTQILIF